MSTTIRTECIADFPQVAEVHTLAHDGGAGWEVAVLTDMLRHRPRYDLQLSIVAEVDGVVVGHALFSPYSVWIEGTEFVGAELSPLSVHPSFHRRGIGKMLMYEGHRRLVDKEYPFTFHMGVPSYYPQFGYHNYMLGRCRLRVLRRDISALSCALEQRQVAHSDLPALNAMWREWFHDAPLAVCPGQGLLDWMTHGSTVTTCVVVQRGEVIGFVRHAARQPNVLTLFVSRDRESASLVLSLVNDGLQAHVSEDVFLCVHPSTRAAREWMPCRFTPDLQSYDAGFVKVLDLGCAPIVEYCRRLGDGSGHLGIVVNPPIPGFD